MKLSKFFYACTVWMMASLVQAQDAKELSDLRADTALRTQNISAAEAELGKYNGRIEALKADIAAAEQALEQAKTDDSQAAIAFSGDPTPANKRTADRASSSLVLAERKVASLTKRLEFSESKKAEAETLILSNTRLIAANNVRQQQLLEEIKIQEQAKVGAEQRAAEQEAQKAAQLAAAAKAEQARKERERLEAEAAAEEKNVESELSDTEELERAVARLSVNEIEKYLNGEVSSRAALRRPVLRSSKDGRLQFEHLGGEIYLVEAPLKAGEHRMVVESSRYKVMVSDEDGGEVFKIYLDNRDKDSMKLMTFKKSLLD